MRITPSTLSASRGMGFAANQNIMGHVKEFFFNPKATPGIPLGGFSPPPAIFLCTNPLKIWSNPQIDGA